MSKELHLYVGGHHSSMMMKSDPELKVQYNTYSGPSFGKRYLEAKLGSLAFLAPRQNTVCVIQLNSLEFDLVVAIQAQRAAAMAVLCFVYFCKFIILLLRQRCTILQRQCQGLQRHDYTVIGTYHYFPE